MKFDAILKELGEFGPYQKRVYFLLCLISLSGGIEIMMSVFILATPNHRCAIPSMSNDTYAIQSTWHREQLFKAIPQEMVHSTTSFSSCLLKEGNITSKCQSWVYDKSVFQNTFTAQENWVCDQTMMKSHTQMLLMVGACIGCFLVVPSDIIGRKRILIIALFVYVGSCFTLAFSPNFAMFGTMSFFVGASISGVFTNAFVIGMEFVGTSKRIWAGMIIEVFWASGEMLLAAIAYFIRDWKTLQLTVSAPTVLFLSYYWFIPESARWLISKGKHQSAEKILKRIAKGNKTLLPPQFSADAYVDTELQQPIWIVITKPRLLARTLIIFFNWFVCSMGYYGLGLNVGNLGGNIYINFLISGLAETAGFLLCILLLDRIGRKALHCSAMMIGGIACMVSLFPVLYAPENIIHEYSTEVLSFQQLLSGAFVTFDLRWITVALSMIGRGFVSCAFGTIWIFSSELFPTVIRSSGMGSSAMSARVGGIISPYIANLADLMTGDIRTAVPLIVFGLSMMMAGILSLFLPETRNRDLPETIEDADNFHRYSRRVPSESDAAEEVGLQSV